jgi:hypothetical protein
VRSIDMELMKLVVCPRVWRIACCHSIVRHVKKLKQAFEKGTEKATAIPALIIVVRYRYPGTLVSSRGGRHGSWLRWLPPGCFGRALMWLALQSMARLFNLLSPLPPWQSSGRFVGKRSVQVGCRTRQVALWTAIASATRAILWMLLHGEARCGAWRFAVNTPCKIGQISIYPQVCSLLCRPTEP